MRGNLIELATGEGKSLVIAALAVVKSLNGVKVDIACSSPILAQRDEQDWRSFYSFFGLNSAAISNASRSQVQETYKKDIVYGTVHDFSADVLKQEFEGTKTRHQRGFKCLVIDEVDNLTIDNCLHQTLLSSKATGLHHLRSLFVKIWQYVIGFPPLPSNKGYFNSPQYFINAIKSLIGEAEDDSQDKKKKEEKKGDHLLSGFFGVLLKLQEERKVDCMEEIKEVYEKSESMKDFMSQCEKTINSHLLKNTAGTLQESIMDIMLTTFEIDANVYILKEDNTPGLQHTATTKTDKNLIIFPNGHIGLYFEKDKAYELIENKILEMIDSNDPHNSLMIPTYLKMHAKKMLPTYIENGFLVAYNYSEGEHYKISKSLDAKGSDDSQFDSAISVDLISTGILQKNMKYSGGIQQFLEMKHHLALSEVTLTTNFMSNFSFYNRYKQLFGLTGTLGNDSDKLFLQEKLDLASQQIPSHKVSEVRKCPLLVKGSIDAWLEQIVEDATSVAMSGQCVLVVCNDMNTAEQVYKNITEKPNEKIKVFKYWLDDVHNLPEKVRKGDIIKNFCLCIFRHWIQEKS